VPPDLIRDSANLSHYRSSNTAPNNLEELSNAGTLPFVYKAPDTINAAKDHEDLLIKAVEALQDQVAHKTNKLHTEHGPDSSKAFLSALYTLPLERFDRLWTDILSTSTSFPNTPPSSDAGSTPADSSDKGKAAERAHIWNAKLEKFIANAVGALIQLVNSHWEQLVVSLEVGLEVQQLRGNPFSSDKQIRRFYHHLELQKLRKGPQLHWLRRALALIRNLQDFEEFLEENGHPPLEGSNQRLRHAYLVDTYASGMGSSNVNMDDIKRP
jgi:hypothetical protein